MQPFLESLSERILDNGFTLENQIVILPTKRSANFLSRILSDEIDGAAWLPEMFTLNEWASEISGLRPAEHLLTSFTLYEAYLETLGSEAQPLSEFLSWSSILLSDFNDIDAYLIDPKSLFRELIDYTEIDQFSFLDVPLSEKQESYRRFWKTLPTIFERFQKRLTEKKLGTSGLIMRSASEKITGYLEKKPELFITVGGFNALSNSEIELFKAIESSGKGRVFFDADDYLMDANKNSGSFIRKNVKAGLGEILRPKTSFLKTGANVKVISASHKLDQANAIAAILEQTPEDELKETGLILADESMLMPVIERLPQKIAAVNVTMGLGLGDSLFRNWTETWLDLHATSKIEKDGYRLSAKRMAELLAHPFSRLIGIHGSAEFPDAYFDGNSFKGKIGEEVLVLSLRTNEGISFGHLAKSLKWIIQRIKRQTLSRPEVRMGLLGSEKLLETVERLKTFERSVGLDVNGLRQLFMRVLASTKLSLIGEPLRGLQIMGVLETRALSFDNLIICSVDEGNFPKNNQVESFIPFEVRMFHGLPARREKEAVFAYQFYRLLSRSRSFTAVYHTDAGTFSGGEMSRYLMQVREDFEKNAPRRFSQFQLKAAELSHQTEVKSIEKTEKVVGTISDFLVNRGLSASSINRFYESSLEWYYGNVLSLREPQTDEIDPSTFGTIVHHCLEKLFEPFKEAVISPEIVQVIKKRTQGQLRDSFRKEAGKKDFEHGINRLHFETAKKMIHSYLDREYDHLNKGLELEYLESERRAERTLAVSYGGEVLPVKIKGFIDRMETRDGVLHIIDFKTGNVTKTDLSLGFSDKKPMNYEGLAKKLMTKGKILQLMLYDWLLYEENKDRQVVNQIISLTAPGQRELYLEYDNREEAMTLFEEFLQNTVLDMLNADVPIEESEKFKYAVFE